MTTPEKRARRGGAPRKSRSQSASPDAREGSGPGAADTDSPRRKKKSGQRASKRGGLEAHLRRDAQRVLQHQRLLGLGASIAIVGLALVGTHDSKVGGLVVIVGSLLLMGAVHRFGRLGTERVGT